MHDPTLLWPMFALATLTFGVLVATMRRRIAEIRARRIPLRSIATSRGLATLEDVAAADNLRNLCEMPVLFYVGCLVVAASGTATPLLAGLAWAYVALRALHSTIQLTHNRVRPRFYAFAASSAVLAVMWLVAAVELAHSLD